MNARAYIEVDEAGKERQVRQHREPIVAKLMEGGKRREEATSREAGATYIEGREVRALEQALGEDVEILTLQLREKIE